MRVEVTAPLPRGYSFGTCLREDDQRVSAPILKGGELLYVVEAGSLPELTGAALMYIRAREEAL